MPTPSEESNTPTAPEAERPLEDLLDDFVEAAEQFKRGVLELKALDDAERAMVENFIREGRMVFDGFLNSLKPADESAES
ncbi:hypothetical protein JW752_02315 [Candidatus Peregrinibacteria bacterium]|nr:hypothetical protein [Candidatus Peregrinibacteria bacterium]